MIRRFTACLVSVLAVLTCQAQPQKKVVPPYSELLPTLDWQVTSKTGSPPQLVHAPPAPASTPTGPRGDIRLKPARPAKPDATIYLEFTAREQSAPLPRLLDDDIQNFHLMFIGTAALDPADGVMVTIGDLTLGLQLHPGTDRRPAYAELVRQVTQNGQITWEALRSTLLVDEQSRVQAGRFHFRLHRDTATCEYSFGPGTRGAQIPLHLTPANAAIKLTLGPKCPTAILERLELD